MSFSKLVPVQGIEPRIDAYKATVIPFNYTGGKSGGVRGNRTHDLLDANQTLSQLSYNPTF
tara:strand:- start:173 stop:355 length:183 start_codon:yes stop_codon:yes gene_type:complete